MKNNQNPTRNRRLLPAPTCSALPPEFVTYWQTIYANCRHLSHAHHTLIYAWQHGQEIPGYDTNPPASKTGIPEGWSIRRLARFQPDMTVVRIGLRNS